jgi:outer membrane autotransporter protein
VLINSGTITNSGSITVTQTGGDNADAIGIFVENNFDTITNNGSIEVNQTGDNNTDAFGIRVGSNFGDILNSGTITVCGDDSVGIYSDNKYSYESGVGSIENSGTVEAYDSDGELSENAYSIYSVSDTVENTESGVLTGNLYVSGDLINSGIINLAAAEATVGGDFTLSESGTLTILLNILEDSDSDYSLEYSTLSVGGTATLADDSTIAVDVQSGSISESLVIGETLEDVVTATEILVDTETLKVTDTSVLLDFSAVLSDDSTSLDLLIEKGTTVVAATENSGLGGGLGVAGVLDDLGEDGTDDDDLSDFLSALYSMETAGDVAKAVASASPINNTALAAVSGGLSSRFSAILQTRQNAARGFNSGDPVFGDRNLWVKPFASYSEQDNADGSYGFEADSYGVGLGFDGEYGQGSRLGVAFFYADSDVDTNDISQGSDIDSFSLLFYGSTPVLDETTELSYQLGGGWQSTESSRYISASDVTAEGEYTANNLFAQVRGARELQLSDRLRSLAGLELSYSYYSSPSYSESGAGGLNLDVDSFDSDSLVLKATGDFNYALSTTLELLANVGVGYDLIDDDVSVSSSFQGASGLTFTTEGIDNGPFIYEAGAGVSKKLNEELAFDLKYELDGRGSDYTNHTLYAKVNYKF